MLPNNVILQFVDQIFYPASVRERSRDLAIALDIDLAIAHDLDHKLPIVHDFDRNLSRALARVRTLSPFRAHNLALARAPYSLK